MAEDSGKRRPRRPQAGAARPATPSNQTRLDQAELQKWYLENRPIFDEFGLELQKLLKKALKQVGIQFQDVFTRTKGEKSFLDKAVRYPDPRSQIHDVVGLRVITYFNSEIDRVEERLNELFLVDSALRKDKAEDLGPDRLGYRARHLVCTIKPDREALDDWKTFKGIRFEVQVTTVLGHAWAEFEHDRGYKYHGQLPPELGRRLNLAAGLLEVADRELDWLAAEIATYATSVASEIGLGRALGQIDLNAISLRELLVERLPLSVAAGVLETDYGTPDSAELAVSELRAFGVRTLAEVASLIPESYDQRQAAILSGNSLLGATRDFMMIEDAARYFNDAWRESWRAWSPDSVTLLRKFGVDTAGNQDEFDLFVEESD
jgi:putative GTP pyrophosphokinase